MDPLHRIPGVQRFTRLAAALAGMALAIAIVIVLSGSSRTTPVAAQEGTPVATPSPATVSVSGQGTVNVPPDTASITVGVDVTQPNLQEAQAQATDQMTKIIDAVKAGGVEDKDIQTTNYNVNIIYEYDQNGYPKKIQGFQVTNQVNVIVRAEDTLGQLLDDVVAAGANNIYGISFYVDDPSAAASQARKAAVADARQKADELAEAAGMRVGRIVSISENYSPPPMPVDFAQGAAAEDAALRSSVPIQAGSSEVVVNVQIYYELDEV